jgi:hypothetical protein
MMGYKETSQNSRRGVFYSETCWVQSYFRVAPLLLCYEVTPLQQRGAGTSTRGDELMLAVVACAPSAHDG